MADQAAFTAKYFGSWQEWNRAEAVRDLPPGDARWKIIYQLGQRLAEPPTKREY